MYLQAISIAKYIRKENLQCGHVLFAVHIMMIIFVLSVETKKIMLHTIIVVIQIVNVARKSYHQTKDIVENVDH